MGSVAVSRQHSDLGSVASHTNKSKSTAQQDFRDQLEEFKRKREELRKQRETIFTAHSASMKKFDGEAKKIKTERKQLNARFEMVNTKVMREKSIIDSKKLVRQRTYEKQQQEMRDSLERFKAEIGATDVRGVSFRSGRFRKFNDGNTLSTRPRTRGSLRKNKSTPTSRRPTAGCSTKNSTAFRNRRQASKGRRAPRVR